MLTLRIWCCIKTPFLVFLSSFLIFVLFLHEGVLFKTYYKTIVIEGSHDLYYLSVLIEGVSKILFGKEGVVCAQMLVLHCSCFRRGNLFLMY